VALLQDIARVTIVGAKAETVGEFGRKEGGERFKVAPHAAGADEDGHAKT
jgi:hypothetical protein